MTSEEEYTAAKDRARQTWDSGDFGAIAKLIAGVGEDIVDRVDVGHGEAVLDVACGTGTTTLPAARRGAEAHGLDIAPGLLEEARANAAAEGLKVDFVLGDAEALPWPEATFDVVLSTFGCMFAPRHEVAAAEIARVLKPGGRIGLCCWTPTGGVGGFLRTTAAHLPPPPAWFRPPPLWGVPDAAAAYAALLALGATPLDPVTDVGEGIRVAAVIDPFGNRLGVIENPYFSPSNVR